MKYKLLISFLFFITISHSIISQDVVIEMETEKSKIDILNETFEATDGIVLKYNDLQLRADSMKKLPGQNIIVAYGNVMFVQGNQTVNADEAVFDLDTKKIKITGAKVYDEELKLYFGGEETGSDSTGKTVIKNAWFTMSPFDDPSYKIKSDKLTIYPKRKLEVNGLKLNVKGKDIFSFPYYVTSLRPINRRATLFPYIGSDTDRGLYGIMGFDYEKGNLFNGFIDTEISQKKKIAFRMANDYKVGDYNSGSLFFRRFVVPFKKEDNEWDMELNHSVNYSPKKDINDLKFYELGYGIWNLNYRNITTNLMYSIDGSLLRDDYTSYINTYKRIGTYDFKIDQEVGKTGEFNFDYHWTDNKEAVKELAKINDDIVDKDEIDPRNTDIDMYKNIKYSNENNDFGILVHNEAFEDINPGYSGDINSFKRNEEYLFDLKSPKIRIGYKNSNNDEYSKVLNLKELDDADPNLTESSTRLLKMTEYNKNKSIGVNFGNYYPFRKTEFLGYTPGTKNDNLFQNMYFAGKIESVDIIKKTYEYDYTTDNPNYKLFYLDPTTNDNSRIYKIFEDGDKIRRAKKIIDEKYFSEGIKIGNDRINFPLKDSFISYEYNFERRDYDDISIPFFDSDRRKVEDNSSKTGYQIFGGKQKPEININNLSTNLFLTMYDNTSLTNNKYDLKIVNRTPLFLQYTNAKNATHVQSGIKHDIIEIPSNIYGIGNDLNIYLGNVRFNYDFYVRRNHHFEGNWLEEGDVRNTFRASIDNKRFISLNLQNSKYYEYEDFKSNEYDTKEIQYGYTTDEDDSFLYKISQNEYKIFSNDILNGWEKNRYKEKVLERILSVNYNEWGFEYGYIDNRINDIFNGRMDLKLDTNKHRLGFVYDTSKMKNKQFESNHYFRVSYEFGENEYRNLNNTPVNYADDRYINAKDETVLSVVYRYENTASPRYANKLNKGSINSKVANEKIVSTSNTQNFKLGSGTRTDAFENENLTEEEKLCRRRKIKAK